MAEDARILVGRNVRRLRLAAKITQAALAERMGVDRAYVSSLELGQRNPTVVTLLLLRNQLQDQAMSQGAVAPRELKIMAQTATPITTMKYVQI